MCQDISPAVKQSGKSAKPSLTITDRGNVGWLTLDIQLVVRHVHESTATRAHTHTHTRIILKIQQNTTISYSVDVLVNIYTHRRSFTDVQSFVARHASHPCTNFHQNSSATLCYPTNKKRQRQNSDILVIKIILVIVIVSFLNNHFSYYLVLVIAITLVIVLVTFFRSF